MQLSGVYSLCITVNEDLDNGNGVCTFQKYGDQRQLQSFVVSILPLGSSTVCVCSCWKFIFSCPAVGCTAWVARWGGGGVVFCTSQLCGNCGNIVRKHDMRYQFLGWRRTQPEECGVCSKSTRNSRYTPSRQVRFSIFETVELWTTSF